MFLLCLDTTPDQERAFFEQLYLKYHRLMYKTASMYVTDQSDIEDVLQDAIERLLVRTPKIDENSVLRVTYISCLYS